MPETIKVEPLQLNPILKDVDKGLLKIPQFQREVVWELADSVRLLDSMYRGFPIGCFVIWQTQEQLSGVRSIGPGVQHQGWSNDDMSTKCDNRTALAVIRWEVT